MGETSTTALIFSALASGIQPPPTIKPSDWASENIVLVDGPLAGEKWNKNYAPYLIEILDKMDPAEPCTKVRVRKPSQVGFTQVATAWLGYIAAVAPAPTLVVFPTIQAAMDYNEDKLDPAIEASPTLNKKIRAMGGRSGKASTSKRKKFPGGSILLTGANSSVDLRSKTIKNAVRDEIDDWPHDLNGQGDPMVMVDARQRVYYASGDYKDLGGSTPTIQGISRSDDEFEGGDQRYFKITCPGCGTEQRLVFENLEFDKVWPFDAYYLCPHGDGCVIDNADRERLVLEGRWVAEEPGPGKYPSYHIDILLSPAVTWNQIAAEFLESKDDPAKLKGFVNLWLGESWEERGDAPEWNRLFARREDYAARTIPPGGIILTGASDIQGDGIYYEVTAWGRDKQSWSIDIGFLQGDTADPTNKVWSDLDEVYERRYPDSYGNSWQVDAFAVDSGFNTNAVYLWCRSRPRAMAIKGNDGWHNAAISSTPTKVDINWRGKRVRRGVELWHIGTWPLKAELYAHLRKEGVSDGAELNPPGFCHFSDGLHDEHYLKQLTSEYIKQFEVNGRTIKRWVPSGPNHYHDCRIYNMALAVRKGVGVMTEGDWDKWVAARCRPAEPVQGDLMEAASSPSGLGVENDKPRRPEPVARRRAKKNFVGGW